MRIDRNVPRNPRHILLNSPILLAIPSAIRLENPLILDLARVAAIPARFIALTPRNAVTASTLRRARTLPRNDAKIAAVMSS